MVPRGKKPDVRVIGILIMAILPVLVGLVIVANLMSGPSGGPATVTPVIPVVTTLRTQLPQTTGTPVITQYSGTWINAGDDSLKWCMGEGVVSRYL